MAKTKGHRRSVNTIEDNVRRTETRHESELTRWSRRKATARAEQATPPRPVELPRAETAKKVSAIERTDADMPAIDSLNGDSDYSAFLSPKVSEKLRRMALRKLFHLPQYNVPDALDFCNGDFRNFTPMGNIITADMRYHMQRELEAMKELTDKKSVDDPASEISTVTKTEKTLNVVNETTQSADSSGEPDKTVRAYQTAKPKKAKKGKG